MARTPSLSGRSPKSRDGNSRTPVRFPDAGFGKAPIRSTFPDSCHPFLPILLVIRLPGQPCSLPLLRKNHFLAQIRTAGRAIAPLLEHCTSLSPMSVGGAFAPQNAESAISSAAQPSGQPPDPQSIRRILVPDSPGLPLSPLSPLRP